MLRWFSVLVLVGCAPDPVLPDTPWAAGELRVQQLDLDRWIGASTLIVGPDGTSVLIDVGNERHADTVSASVEATVGVPRVDYTLITHFHSDHVGAFDRLVEDGFDPGTLVTRGPVHLDGSGANEGELAEVQATTAWTGRVDLCDEGGCALPFVIELGDGATLTVFAADGSALGEDGVVPFDGELRGTDPGENARSLAGAVGWGPFRYVFAGDMTGGGKATPDVESFVAAHVPESVVPATGADLLQLSHHGIESSNQIAWLDRFLPDDGAPRNALVGSNGGYLDAPSHELLDRLRDRLHGGSVWANRAGALSGDDELLRVATGPVIVRVLDGGRAYQATAGAAHGDWPSAGAP